MKEQIAFYKNKLDFEMDSSDLWEVLKTNKNVIALDTRKSNIFTKEHIPGAINIPHREINCASTKYLDKTKTYVCYCDGIGCNASTKGALKMTELGFKVKELIGGIAWWKLDGYATEGNTPTVGTAINCSC